MDKKTADIILTKMERLRQEYEHGNGCEDYVIRVCQAIVAQEAGYTDRGDWSAPIFRQVEKERMEAEK